MISIKTIWFYALLAATFGGGIGAGVVVSPSEADIEAALRKQAREIAVVDCSMQDGPEWRRVEPRNSPGREF